MLSLHSTLPEQLDAVTECHRTCFASSFGTKVGYAYSRRSMEWFLAGDNRFLFHVTSHGKVIGYCGGFQSKGIGDGSTSGMMQFAMKEAITGIIKKPWLLFNKEIRPFYPLIFKNIYRKIFAKQIVFQPTPSNNFSNIIGLVVIGVLPAYRGKGCFNLLMQHFAEVCKKRGSYQMRLSVRTSNVRAIAAYKKAGWLIGAQKKETIEMYKNIPA